MTGAAICFVFLKMGERLAVSSRQLTSRLKLLFMEGQNVILKSLLPKTKAGQQRRGLKSSHVCILLRNGLKESSTEHLEQIWTRISTCLHITKKWTK